MKKITLLFLLIYFSIACLDESKKEEKKSAEIETIDSTHSISKTQKDTFQIKENIKDFYEKPIDIFELESQNLPKNKSIWKRKKNETAENFVKRTYPNQKYKKEYIDGIKSEIYEIYFGDTTFGKSIVCWGGLSTCYIILLKPIDSCNYQIHIHEGPCFGAVSTAYEKIESIFVKDIDQDGLNELILLGNGVLKGSYFDEELNDYIKGIDYFWDTYIYKETDEMENGAILKEIFPIQINLNKPYPILENIYNKSNLISIFDSLGYCQFLGKYVINPKTNKIDSTISHTELNILYPVRWDSHTYEIEISNSIKKDTICLKIDSKRNGFRKSQIVQKNGFTVLKNEYDKENEFIFYYKDSTLTIPIKNFKNYFYFENYAQDTLFFNLDLGFKE